MAEGKEQYRKQVSRHKGYPRRIKAVEQVQTKKDFFQVGRSKTADNHDKPGPYGWGCLDKGRLIGGQNILGKKGYTKGAT